MNRMFEELADLMEIKKAEILAEVMIIENHSVFTEHCSGSAEEGVKEVGAGSSEEKHKGAACFSF